MVVQLAARQREMTILAAGIAAGDGCWLPRAALVLLFPSMAIVEGASRWAVAGKAAHKQAETSTY